MSEQPPANNENSPGSGGSKPRSPVSQFIEIQPGGWGDDHAVPGAGTGAGCGHCGYFGSSMAADAFFVAFKIPNFLRRLFAEGAFSQAFVPVLSEYRSKKPLEEVQVWSVGSVVCWPVPADGDRAMHAGVAILIRLFAPGFIDEPEKLALAGSMLRITFPYLLLISLTALAGGILNSYSRFAVPAFTPVLLNLSLIGATVLLTPYFADQ